MMLLLVKPYYRNYSYLQSRYSFGSRIGFALYAFSFDIPYKSSFNKTEGEDLVMLIRILSAMVGTTLILLLKREESCGTFP